MRSSFQAMGTEVVVVAPAQSHLAATHALFAENEARFSRFVATSELSAINERGGDRVEVSPQMAALLREAVRLRRWTDGVVDPAVGAAVASWGYDRSFDEIGPTERKAPHPDVGRWRIDESTLTLDPGVALDLGGLAKGWTCDVAVTSGRAAIVSAGGDVRSSHADAAVELLDSTGTVATVLDLGEAGLATSSTAKRRWRTTDGEAHHVIDPRTGNPAVSPVTSSTVVAETAIDAEAGAKAVLIKGRSGLQWADDQPWLRGTIVEWHDGSVFATGKLQEVR